MRFSASVAAANPLSIGEEIQKLQGWPELHFDMEDGNFTPNITFGMSMLRSVAREIVPRQLDVHLMMNHPVEVLPDLAQHGVARVCAHLEAQRYPLLFLNRAKALGMHAGLALNIQTPLSLVEPFVPAMDYLLVMTSEPDGAGEKLWLPALEKVAQAVNMLPIPIWADGGLTEESIQKLHKAGAAGCALGRLVFGAKDPPAMLLELKKKYGGSSYDPL